MKHVAAALVKAQKEFGPALKTSTNPHFRTKYADLSACVEAVIDALNNNGIAMMQHTQEHVDGIVVETVFLHESGEMVSNGKLFVPAAKNDPQGFGSALTYARRYSLMAACGIAPEDDDANSATAAVRAKQAAPQPKAEPKKEPIPQKIEGKGGEWTITVTTDPGFETEKWVELVREAALLHLTQTKTSAEVMMIFKKNRNIFDRLMLENEPVYKELLSEFGKKKDKFMAEEQSKTTTEEPA